MGESQVMSFCLLIFFFSDEEVYFFTKRVVEKLHGEEIDVLARFKGRVKLKRALEGRKHEMELCFVTLDVTIEGKGRVMECGSAIS